MFERAALFLGIALLAPFYGGCLGDDLLPSEGGTYEVSLEPTLKATVYFYDGVFRVAPKLDYSKYWSGSETLATRELSIRTEAAASPGAPETLVMTLPSLSGEPIDVKLELDPHSLTASGPADWESGFIAEGCLHGYGSAFSLSFSDSSRDEFVLERVYEHTYSFGAINPPSCEPPLAELGEQLAAYVDPLSIPDPVWRLFVASKLLPLDLVKKVIVLRIQTLETGRLIR